MEHHFAELAEQGFTVVPGVLQAEQLSRVRDALYRAAAEDRARGREVEDFPLDAPEARGRSQRVWNLLSRDPLFEDLVVHPVALAFVRAVLGWPALLGNFSANLCGPGTPAGMLHADQTFLPEPWPAVPVGLNAAWAIDAFTAESGATRVVPGSHRWNRPARPEEQEMETVAMEAPAGSLVVFESRLWHRTGANVTADRTRAAAFAWYTRTFVRQQENWYLSLRPEVRQYATEEMLTLLGYRTAGFGMVNGRSPA
ncbi:MAG: hypothetical protein KatS3mg124_1088 [Porticoccaceae bacterium]|nr:MAG: hypothetical protein KatS3mg124_1088 [Porticoccaceae bacterium]